MPMRDKKELLAAIERKEGVYFSPDRIATTREELDRFYAEEEERQAAQKAPAASASVASPADPPAASDGDDSPN